MSTQFMTQLPLQQHISSFLTLIIVPTISSCPLADASCNAKQKVEDGAKFKVAQLECEELWT